VRLLRGERKREGNNTTRKKVRTQFLYEEGAKTVPQKKDSNRRKKDSKRVKINTIPRKRPGKGDKQNRPLRRGSIESHHRLLQGGLRSGNVLGEEEKGERTICKLPWGVEKRKKFNRTTVFRQGGGEGEIKKKKASRRRSY